MMHRLVMLRHHRKNEAQSQCCGGRVFTVSPGDDLYLRRTQPVNEVVTDLGIRNRLMRGSEQAAASVEADLIRCGICRDRSFKITQAGAYLVSGGALDARRERHVRIITVRLLV